MARVGFIGLGLMGNPMARNLLKAGHELFFFARRQEVIDEFCELGATPCASCGEVAKRSDSVFTIVTADQQVEQVVLGNNGVIEEARDGKMLIEMSTVSPNTARKIGSRLAAVGMSMLDAPVSGGPGGARNATLTIMVGGEPDAFDRAQGLLKVLGQNIFHLGPLGAGQTTKLVNQLMAGGMMTLVGEGIAIAKSAGLDLGKMVEVVSLSSGNSTVFNARHQFVIDDRYQPGFTSALMRKDIALAIDLAMQLGVETPVASAALRQYDVAIQRGDADQDFAVVAKTHASGEQE